MLFIREELLLRGVVSVESVQTEEGNHFLLNKFQFTDKGEIVVSGAFFCAAVFPSSECLETVWMWTVTTDTPPITVRRPCLSSGKNKASVFILL
jgi:hypothetical protein